MPLRIYGSAPRPAREKSRGIHGLVVTRHALRGSLASSVREIQTASQRPIALVVSDPSECGTFRPIICVRVRRDSP